MSHSFSAATRPSVYLVGKTAVSSTASARITEHFRLWHRKLGVWLAALHSIQKKNLHRSQQLVRYTLCLDSKTLFKECCVCRSFCSALLLGLPKLGPSLTAHTSRATGTSCHTVFLQLLGRLLELDSKTVLDLSHPSFDFVFQSYLDILALR